MAKLYNLARMTTATTGTGTITLGSAVASYVTFALAGVQNGDTVTYAIVDGNNREVGRGVYTSAGTTLTRATILESTNANAAINLSGSAEVFITAAAEDITSSVEITGGSISGITDLAVADGGTGRSSATAYALIAGGTTSTGAHQSVSGVGTSGQVLTSNGAGALPTWANPAAATGTLLRAPQILTSGTSYTTPAGCTRIYVEMVGGGAAGTAGGSTSSSGAGGGAGGYAARYFTVTPSTAYTYAIGAGGSGSNGAAGGNTTFTVGATTVTANGGSGSTGGTPTNGDVNIRGGNATNGTSSITEGSGAAGASSFFGGGGGGGRGDSTAGGTGQPGTDGVAGGGGGGGGNASGSGSSDGARGNGGAGLIRIWEYA